MGQASIALIARTAKGGNASTVTSDAIDSTYANLLVVHTSWYNPTNANNLSDSYGNVWVTQWENTSSSGITITAWYCKNPIVGPGHTFTSSGSGTFNPCITVSAWSYANTNSPFESKNALSQAAGSGPLVLNSITPALPKELVVTAVAIGRLASGITIDSGYGSIQSAQGAQFTIAEAYQISPAPAIAIVPSWNWTGSAAFGSAGGQTVFRAIDYPFGEMYINRIFGASGMSVGGFQ